MGANVGAIAGSQVFRTEDGPRYLHAFAACLALSAFNILQIVAQSIWYFIRNRKLARDNQQLHVIHTTTDATADGHREALIRTWWWSW